MSGLIEATICYLIILASGGIGGNLYVFGLPLLASQDPLTCVAGFALVFGGLPASMVVSVLLVHRRIAACN